MTQVEFVDVRNCYKLVGKYIYAYKAIGEIISVTIFGTHKNGEEIRKFFKDEDISNMSFINHDYNFDMNVKVENGNYTSIRNGDFDFIANSKEELLEMIKGSKNND